MNAWGAWRFEEMERDEKVVGYGSATYYSLVRVFSFS
jgi:hypothetical protein